MAEITYQLIKEVYKFNDLDKCEAERVCKLMGIIDNITITPCLHLTSESDKYGYDIVEREKYEKIYIKHFKKCCESECHVLIKKYIKKLYYGTMEEILKISNNLGKNKCCSCITHLITNCCNHIECRCNGKEFSKLKSETRYEKCICLNNSFICFSEDKSRCVREVENINENDDFILRVLEKYIESEINDNLRLNVYDNVKYAWKTIQIIIDCDRCFQTECDPKEYERFFRLMLSEQEFYDMCSERINKFTYKCEDSDDSDEEY